MLNKAVTVTMTFDLQTIETADAFEHPAWPALREKDPNAHIFTTPEWNRVWWEEFGRGQGALRADDEPRRRGGGDRPPVPEA